MSKGKEQLLKARQQFREVEFQGVKALVRQMSIREFNEFMRSFKLFDNTDGTLTPSPGYGKALSSQFLDPVTREPLFDPADFADDLTFTEIRGLTKVLVDAQGAGESPPKT